MAIFEFMCQFALTFMVVEKKGALSARAVTRRRMQWEREMRELKAKRENEAEESD